MLKLVVGIVGALVLSVLAHTALVYVSNSGTGMAPAAQSTCASCHG